MSRLIHPRVIATIAAIVAVGALLIRTDHVSAAPVISSVTTSADYRTVTVEFSSPIEVTDGGDIQTDDISLSGAPELTSVSLDGGTITMVFVSEVQPATAVIGFPGTNAAGLTTPVPLSDSDWTDVKATLTSIKLPAVSEVPIATQWMAPDDDGEAQHTLGELMSLPADDSSSLDLLELSSPIVVERTATGFTAELDGTEPLSTDPITATLAVDGTAADKDAGFGVTLGSDAGPTIDMEVRVEGTLTLDTSGDLTSADDLVLVLHAGGTPTLAGSIGFVGAEAATELTLDASFAFDPLTEDPPIVDLTAKAALGPVTIPDLGPAGGDIVLESDPDTDPLATFNWSGLPVPAMELFSADLQTEILFAVSQDFQGELNERVLSDALRTEFEGNGSELSAEAGVVEVDTDAHWRIYDPVSGRTYIVDRSDERLDVVDPDSELAPGTLSDAWLQLFADKYIDISADATIETEEEGARWRISDSASSYAVVRLPGFEENLVGVSSVRQESVQVDPAAWDANGLRKLTTISVNDLIGAPGGFALFLAEAQAAGDLATPLPIVGATLGESVGIAQTLAVSFEQMAKALSVATGPYAIRDDFENDPEPPPPLLTAQNLCSTLGPLRVQAAKVDAARAAALAQAEADGEELSEEDLREEILDRLDAGVVVDESGIEGAFLEICDSMYGALVLDLTNSAVESSVAIPTAELSFLEDGPPSLSLGFDEAGLGDLTAGGASSPDDWSDWWSGNASVTLDFTLGLKLVPDEDLLIDEAMQPNNLVIDIDEDGDVDADDVTSGHRVYIPEGELVATSNATISGTDISLPAQIGFLDLNLSGDVSLTPSVSLTTLDPATGMDDGKLDLAEMLDAAEADAATGERSISSALTVETGNDDVDVHFIATNDLIQLSANLDIVGDLSGALEGGTIEARTTGISGPDEVDDDTLAIGHTFGDALEVAEVTPGEAATLTADLLEALAANSAGPAGEQRIPVIDVTVDEMLQFTKSLANVAATIRERPITSMSKLVAVVNDGLAAEGMGAVTVGFATSSDSPSGDPELTVTIDASARASASYPVSFDMADDLGPLSIAPIDGGARLTAEAVVDFEPTVGIRFNNTDALEDRIFVRDVSARFDVFLEGTADGAVRVGPLEASIFGTARAGDADLTAGGFTVGLKRSSDGSATIPLSAFASAGTEVTLDVGGSLVVYADLELDMSFPGGDASGTIEVLGVVPGPPPDVTTTFESDFDPDFDLRDALSALVPNLGALADGTVQTARFMARGADEVSDLGDSIPVVGRDVAAQFDDVSDVLNLVADEVEETVAFLESSAGDPAVLLETEIDSLLQDDLGCTVCDSRVYWVDDDRVEDPSLTLLTASGLEILLTLSDEMNATASTTANLALDPVLDIEFDVSEANATIGYRAEIGLGLNRVDGFYLFPGIDNGESDTGTLLEIYASLDLDSEVSLTIAGLSATAGADVTIAGPLNEGTAAGLKVDMPDPLPFTDIVNRRRSLSETLIPSLNADVHAELPIVLAVEAGSIGLGLTLPIVFDWEFADSLVPSFDDAELKIENASLDIGSLVAPIGDAVEEFNGYNPLAQPKVKKALDTNVPLIEKTVREVMVAACHASGGGNACKAFEFLSNTAELEAFLEEFEGGTVVIGSFQIFPAPPVGQSRYTPPTTVLMATPGATVVTATQADGGKATLKEKLEKLTGGYMSAPILDDYAALMGIVLGGELTDEVDIVRLEIPADAPLIIGKSINFRKTLLDLDVGFLDGYLHVAINGGIGLKISGGFGYSTRGIQTGDPLDGIFLIDGDGCEIALYAGLSASVDGRLSVLQGLFSVRFSGSGSFSAEAGLDLYDESPALVGIGGGDGRLYIDEIEAIADAHHPPATGLPSELCMFQLRTTGTWSLSFSGKLKIFGITVFNKSYSAGGTLWDETLACKLRTRIARVENRQLILHAGPYARDRFDGEGDRDEGFSVDLEGSNVRVRWTAGGTKPSMTFPLSSFDTIVADMGNYNDTVDVANDVVKPLTARGGPGSDTLSGGGGDDDIDGGPGADTLDGRGGDDLIRGGSDGDTLTGGPDDDDLFGGQGDDTTKFANGFGSDTLDDPEGSNTLDFEATASTLTGDTSYGDATIIAEDGSKLEYLSGDITTIIAGAADDSFRFKDQEPDGFSFDGSEGSDAVTFEAGSRARQVSISDTGSAADSDTLTVLGSAAADDFLLRASSDTLGVEGTIGFVARISGSVADRYDYDDSIEHLTVDGQAASDTFALDDNATDTHIVGGPGRDRIQIGQIYGLANCDGDDTAEGPCPSATDDDSLRDGTVGVTYEDRFIATVISRGHLSNGVTHPLVVDGDDGDDSITVFSNRAAVTANGGAGSDRFVARAFIITASVQLNGEGDVDDFSYVVNALLSVDGGPGVDSFTIVGTEADDGFVIDVDADGNTSVLVCKLGSDGLPDITGECAIDANVQNVEVFDVLGLEGDDVYWIRATEPTSLVNLLGGGHSDRFVVGDGTLEQIDGPVVVSGDDSGTVPAIPDPVVLPSEDATPGFDPAAVGGSDVGDQLEVDASGDVGGLSGEITEAAVRGFGLSDGPFTIGTPPDETVVAEALTFDSLEFARIETGTGSDEVTVLSSHVGNGICDAVGCPLKLLTGDGEDMVYVHSISGEARFDLGAGADVATVGLPVDGGRSLDAIDAALTVLGGDDGDRLDLDDTADGGTRVDIDPGLVTQAGLHADGVSHQAVEQVNVYLGTADDVANVRGTASDASSTHVYGNEGNDRYYVSSEADLGTLGDTDYLGGDLDDVYGPLFVHGGEGALNRLMVSDREAVSGDGAVTYDGAVLSGLSPAAITHDVVGAFGGGIVIFTSEFGDTLAISGSSLSTMPGIRTLTSVNTGAGDDSVTVALLDGTDGPIALNTEEGGDVIVGEDSTQPLVVFGGLGSDTISTGSGDDVVLGDLGIVETEDGGTRTGGGGPGDDTDGGTQPLDVITSDAAGGAADTIETGAGNDIVFSGTGADTVEAGAGDDVVLGGHGSGDPRRVPPIYRSVRANDAAVDTGDTLLSGGPGLDLVYGQQGQDTIHGGPDADVLIGGHSTAGALDGVAPLDGSESSECSGDVIHGGAGEDTILGDNGMVDESVTLHDMAARPDEVPEIAGCDMLYGDDDMDALFGQHRDDELWGGGADDAMEGNGGNDRLRGDSGDDALTGGSSAADGRIVPLRDGTGASDGADELHGGTGDDVIAGDNARIERQKALRVDGTRLRTILLFDLAREDYAVAAATGAGDEAYGDAGRDLIFGQQGDDQLYGGDDDDAIEGNAGADTIAGDGGEDDLIGGGSASDGAVIGLGASGLQDRLFEAPGVLTDPSAAGLDDGADDVYGGSDPDNPSGTQPDSHDVILGDNGRITRPGNAVLDGGDWAARRVRVVAMADDGPGDTSGSDWLFGQAGDDDLYGQFDDSAEPTAHREWAGGVTVPGDVLDGGPGDDALIGDQGVDTPTPASDIGSPEVLKTRGSFVREEVLAAGSLIRVVELSQVEIGGDDVLVGASGSDSIHAGAGGDFADGGEGVDAVFGADGDDALWGGAGHDRLFGGAGADALDVKPRTTDPALWAVVAPDVDTDDDPETVNDSDLAYGGFDPDALQADVGEAGPAPGDRLLDWVGAYDVYYVCDGAYGAGRIQRRPDPTTQDVLIDLARALGAVEPASDGSSGWHELALVTQKDIKDNSHPKHPDHPGHFTCEGE